MTPSGIPSDDFVGPASALLGRHLPLFPAGKVVRFGFPSFKTHQRAVLGRMPLLPDGPNPAP